MPASARLWQARLSSAAEQLHLHLRSCGFWNSSRQRDVFLGDETGMSSCLRASLGCELNDLRSRSMKIMGRSRSSTDCEWLYASCLKMYDIVLVLNQARNQNKAFI